MRESLSVRSNFRYTCTVDVQYDDRPPERHEIEWLYDVLTPQFRVKFRRTGQDGDWNWLIQKPSEHIYKAAESKYLAVESGKANIRKGRFIPIVKKCYFAGTVSRGDLKIFWNLSNMRTFAESEAVCPQTSIWRRFLQCVS